ncbi:MAG: phospholipid carrier-dependent glycosyltransferase, partial [Chloroflexi bacterium]
MEEVSEVAPRVLETQPARRVRLGALPGARVLVFVPLFLILVVGAYFRFTGLNWDEDQHLHPDERFLTMVLSSLERPASVGEFFNTSASGWNPYNKGWDFFVYGTLPIFIIRFVGEELGKTGYGEIYLVGRALSGLFDLLTVLLLFFIARRLYDDRVALLASALSAAAVLQIQQSHFMTVDSFATTFTMLAFLGAVLVVQEGRLWQYVLMGAGIGMAVASRINLVLLGPLAVVAAGVYLYRTLPEADTPQARSKLVEQTAVRLVLAGIVSIVAFRIFQPYAFQGPGFLGVHLNAKWVQNMRSIRAQATGEVDMPPSHQWTNRPAYLFPLSHMVLWGLGLPLGIAAWAGWLLAGWQILRQRRWQHVLPVAWVLILFGYQGQQFTKTMRYFLQIYPVLAMLGAFLLVWLW